MRSGRKSLKFCGLASSTYLFLFTVEGLVIAFVGFSKQSKPVNLETKFQRRRSCEFRFDGFLRKIWRRDSKSCSCTL